MTWGPNIQNTRLDLPQNGTCVLGLTFLCGLHGEGFTYIHVCVCGDSSAELTCKKDGG